MEVFIPRSRIFLSNEPGVRTEAMLQFMPSFSQEHLFFTIEEFDILKPHFTGHCNGITVQSPHRASSSMYDSILSATVSNTGKVGPA